MNELKIPKMALVTLVGPSGSGKSTFAKKHFLPTEILSSDYCRGLVSDDENDQSATNDAFDVLNFIARKRLAAGRLTVVDATNVQATSRKSLINLAREYHVLPVAIVFNISEKVCTARNKERSDRKFGAHVIRQQRSQLRQSLRRLKKEGFRNIFVLESPDEVDAVTIQRVPLWNDKTDQAGPFDIIGDVHGCGDELELLLERLGYESNNDFRHSGGRRAVFVGDLVDRGPRSVFRSSYGNVDGRKRFGVLCSGQPRRETSKQAAWQRCENSPWPGRNTRRLRPSSGRRAGAF